MTLWFKSLFSFSPCVILFSLSFCPFSLPILPSTLHCVLIFAIFESFLACVLTLLLLSLIPSLLVSYSCHSIFLCLCRFFLPCVPFPWISLSFPSALIIPCLFLASFFPLFHFFLPFSLPSFLVSYSFPLLLHFFFLPCFLHPSPPPLLFCFLPSSLTFSCIHSSHHFFIPPYFLPSVVFLCSIHFPYFVIYFLPSFLFVLLPFLWTLSFLFSTPVRSFLLVVFSG